MDSNPEALPRQHPWFKFYPSDWLGNPKVRMLSPENRAALIDLMAVAHFHEPYGYLPERSSLALALPLLEATLGAMLEAMVQAGVLSKVDGQHPEYFFHSMVRERQNAIRGLKNRVASSNAPSNGATNGATVGGGLRSQRLESQSKSISKEIPPPAAAKPRAKPTGPQAEIVEHYSKLYQACYGEPPAILWGRDGAVVKKMLAFAGGAPEKVREKIELAFKDDFCRDTAKVSLGVVLSRWNALLPKSNYNPPVSVSVPKKKERRVYPTELEAWKEITGHGGHAEQVEGGWIFVHGED